jgi:hypothetical protein
MPSARDLRQWISVPLLEASLSELQSYYPSWPEGPALPGLGMNGPLQAPPQGVRLPVSSSSRPGASGRGVRLLEAPGL